MQTISQMNINKIKRPIKVIQFGEGNFLRAFADYMIDEANDKGIFRRNIAIVKPIAFGTLDSFKKQNCNYTVILRGKENGETVNKKKIVTSVSSVYDAAGDYDEWMNLACSFNLRFVISNTTEAGIVFDSSDHFEGLPETYPGKLTKFLYKRYEHFGGEKNRGLIILPVELIEDNGKKLLECVLKLSDVFSLCEEFKKWVKEECVFCSTLVDRIVTGFPRNDPESLFNELTYEDKLAVIAEPFGLWVIESDKEISGEFPLDKAGMPVLFTDNQRPYRERKVRVLNGAHTSFVLAGYLAGFDIVRDCMKDKTVGKFIRSAVKNEIAPYVPLNLSETLKFAESVFERFENPFIDHSLLSISLNSVSKWKARVLPSVTDYYEKNGKLPHLLTFSFAALLDFYRSSYLLNDGLHSKRQNGDEYVIHDSSDVLEFFAQNADNSDEEYVKAVASNSAFFGKDLTEFKGFKELALKYLIELQNDPLNAIKNAAEEK